LEECRLCRIINNENDKFLYEDEFVIIVPTNKMKGHKKRIMIVSKSHLDNNIEITTFEDIFRKYCYEYFDEEPTCIIASPEYATITNHWHRIACDWIGEDMLQCWYTPHLAIKTKGKWNRSE